MFKQNTSSPLFVILAIVLVLLAIVARLASLGTTIAIERDWVVVIAREDASLLAGILRYIFMCLFWSVRTIDRSVRTIDRSVRAIDWVEAQYHRIHYNALQYSTMQYSTIKCNTMQCNSLLQSARSCIMIVDCSFSPKNSCDIDSSNIVMARFCVTYIFTNTRVNERIKIFCNSFFTDSYHQN